MSDVLREIAALKRRVARLEAQDKFEFEPWTAWTPELYGSTTDGTITYTNQVGFYFELDGLVMIYLRLQVSTIPVAPTGVLRIRTLPYTTPNSVNNPPIYFSGRVNLSAGYLTLAGNFPANNTYISLVEYGDDVSQALPAGNLNTNAYFRISAFYRIG